MILVNGHEQAHISAADRGLQYGDGLFETIAVSGGRPRLWQRHWRRLAAGCARLGIEGLDPRQLQDEAQRACADIDDKAVLKLIVTRGEGGRGYRPDRTAKATRIVATYPWPTYPEGYWQQGVAVRVCTTRLGRNAALAGMKHLNRLEQVLARREWDDPQIAEGLMLDDGGHVIAGTMSNVFMVTADRLVTPALDSCGVAGVMRGMILDIAAETALTWEELSVSRRELQQADEVFLCNALIGIWPVRRIEQQDYALGPLTKLISGRLSSILSSE